MFRASTSKPRDPKSKPSQVTPKTIKLLKVSSLLGARHRIVRKGELAWSQCNGNPWVVMSVSLALGQSQEGTMYVLATMLVYLYIPTLRWQ